MRIDMGNAKSIYAPTLEARPEPATFPPEAFLIGQINEYPLDFPGYVYVIQWGDDGPVKIGMAIAPSYRVRELQVGNWAKLTVRAVIPTPCKPKIVERVAHRVALPHLIRGEWFDMSPIDAVSAVLAAAWQARVYVMPFMESVAEFKGLVEINRQIRSMAQREADRALIRRRLGMDP